MAVLNLLEWDGLVELVEIDLSRWGLGVLYFCNSARNWDTNDDGQEEPTDLLDMEFVQWGDNTHRVMPFETSGWRTGGEGVERPKIVIGDVGSVIRRQLQSIGGAKMAPVRHYHVLALDLEENTGDIVGLPHDYMINRITGNGFQTTIELGTLADTTRTPFPPSRYSERDFPGLRNRYDRA